VLAHGLIWLTQGKTPTCSRARMALYTVVRAQPAASAVVSLEGKQQPLTSRQRRPAGRPGPSSLILPSWRVANAVFDGYNVCSGDVAVSAKQSDEKMTTNQNLADENRLEVARRIYHLMCTQYPDRLITLVDPRGCMLARSDGPCVPLAEASNLSN
jgi:hypothetical protein